MAMPIYEFACQDCGHEFEKIQSFSDSSAPACPNCQGLSRSAAAEFASDPFQGQRLVYHGQQSEFQGQRYRW